MPDSVCSRCRMDRERFDAGGRECLSIRRANVSVACRGRRWPTWFRWRRAFLRETCVGQPPGRVPFSCLRAGRDIGLGPVADMACFSRQGSCRNARPKHLPRCVRTAAGATRTEGPEEGQVRKPTSVCIARLPPAGWGRHPASSGPRAVSATLSLAYQRHCPRAALRISLLLTPRRHGSRGLRLRLSKCRGQFTFGRSAGSLIMNGHQPESKLSPTFTHCASKSSTSLSVSGRAWQLSVKPASISQGSSEKFSSMVAVPSTILQRQVQHMPPAQE